MGSQQVGTADMPVAGRGLTYGRIIAFWAPLGLMWLLMAAEQPGLSAVIARMSDPELHLASFGVVMAIALVTESPIIQMLAAATALSGSLANYRLLIRFMHILGVALTVVHLLVAFTPAYDLIVGGLLGVPDDVLEASRIPFAILAPFSAAVGYRRLWQGVLIRHGKTWIVPVSMVIRIVAVAAVLIVGFRSWDLTGSTLASLALSVGVVVAAIVAWVFNRVYAMPELLKADSSEKPMGWHGLLSFYIPLSLTSVIFLLARPVMTFGIARAYLSEPSLAAWPVINGFLFIFNSLALSYQEAGIALLERHPESERQLRRFTAGLAAILSGTMLISAITAVGPFWFQTISGLSDELLALTPVPLLILFTTPALVTYKAWYRAAFVRSGRTNALAWGVGVNTVTLFVAVLIGSSIAGVPGAVSASFAMLVSQVFENGYLLLKRPFGTSVVG